MAKFPITKSGIRAFARDILGGLQTNAAVFPTPPFEPAPLAAAIAQDQVNQAARMNLAAQLEAAILVENEGLKLVVELSKRELALCEATYRNDATKPALFGWTRVRQGGGGSRIGQPGELRATAQTAGATVLEWSSPSSGRARVQYYKIERQITDPATLKVLEPWGQWQMSAVQTEIALSDQPRGVEISYRVMAVAATTVSLPTNNVEMVL